MAVRLIGHNKRINYTSLRSLVQIEFDPFSPKIDPLIEVELLITIVIKIKQKSH